MMVLRKEPRSWQLIVLDREVPDIGQVFEGMNASSWGVSHICSSATVSKISFLSE
jgi:hypothetical protein